MPQSGLPSKTKLIKIKIVYLSLKELVDQNLLNKKKKV